MISWRHSFRRLQEEYEVAVKKKEALDGLLNAGKISSATYEIFDKEIADSINETGKQQRALVARMDAKALELENQTKTLEVLLANFEIQHVTGEIDDQIYQRQTELLTVGLDTMKLELSNVKDAMTALSNDFAENTIPAAEKSVNVVKNTVEVDGEKMPVEEPVEALSEAVQAEASEEPKPVETEVPPQEQKA